MSLSDCEKCWDTPCTCGHEWDRYSLKYLLNLRSVLDSVITKKMETEPKCSRCKGPTTQESICDDCISKLKYDSMR